MPGYKLFLLRVLLVAIGLSCALVLAGTTFYWSMTEEFSLGLPFANAWSTSGIVLLIGLVPTSIGAITILFLRKFGVHRRLILVGLSITAIGLAALLLIKHFWPLYFAVPAGAIIGLLITHPSKRAIGRGATILLSAGLFVWAGLLVQSWRREVQSARLEQEIISPASLGNRILGGTSLGQSIWLMNSDGKVVSYRLPLWQPTIRLREGAVSLANDGHGVWALIEHSQKMLSPGSSPPRRFGLAYHDGHRWRGFPLLPHRNDEAPLALSITPDGPLVLTSRHLYRMSSATEKLDEIPLAQPLDAWGYLVTLAVGNDLYVGVNQGEWGGGLRRINLTSGAVVNIERRIGSNICAGPLNTDCDPVTGLARDDEHPGCLFASVGLSHLMWHGRVVRICGQKIETIFDAPILPIGVRIHRALSEKERRKTLDTEPVFGLMTAPGGFWALTPRSIYRWERGRVEARSLSSPENINGIVVSRSVEGLLAIYTDANAIRSLSGYTPLLFADPTKRP